MCISIFKCNYAKNGRLWFILFDWTILNTAATNMKYLTLCFDTGAGWRTDRLSSSSPTAILARIRHSLSDDATILVLHKCSVIGAPLNAILIAYTYWLYLISRVSRQLHYLPEVWFYWCALWLSSQRHYLCCGFMGIHRQSVMFKQEQTSYFSNQTDRNRRKNELNIPGINHEA